VAWQVEGEVERSEAKLALLCVLCLESALPWGGRIAVQRRGLLWRLVAESTKFRDLAPLWAMFDAGVPDAEIAAADVQFALAPVWAQSIGLKLMREEQAGRLIVTAAPS
jgi:histidine phosphotransferase ChpT